LKDIVPTVLTLEEQSLFALGFYQQKAQLAAIDWNTYQHTHSTVEEGEEQ
jgi:hypothetical protein